VPDYQAAPRQNHPAGELAHVQTGWNIERKAEFIDRKCPVIDDIEEKATL
jgi:hypothetical protein